MWLPCDTWGIWKSNTQESVFCWFGTKHHATRLSILYTWICYFRWSISCIWNGIPNHTRWQAWYGIMEDLPHFKWNSRSPWVVNFTGPWRAHLVTFLFCSIQWQVTTHFLPDHTWSKSWVTLQNRCELRTKITVSPWYNLYAALVFVYR